MLLTKDATISDIVQKFNELKIESKGFLSAFTFLKDWINKTYLSDLENLRTVNVRVRQYTQDLESRYDDLLKVRREISNLKKEIESIKKIKEASQKEIENMQDYKIFLAFKKKYSSKKREIPALKE